MLYSFAIDQNGHQRWMKSTQNRNGNRLHVDQRGANQYSDSGQDGGDDNLLLDQYGSGNRNRLKQGGNNNRLELTQDETGNWADVTQTGQGNATARQTGAANQLNVMQTSGEMVRIDQNGTSDSTNINVANP